jgi:hypothetical protein
MTPHVLIKEARTLYNLIRAELVLPAKPPQERLFSCNNDTFTAFIPSKLAWITPYSHLPTNLRKSTRIRDKKQYRCGGMLKAAIRKIQM